MFAVLPSSGLGPIFFILLGIDAVVLAQVELKGTLVPEIFETLWALVRVRASVRPQMEAEEAGASIRLEAEIAHVLTKDRRLLKFVYQRKV